MSFIARYPVLILSLIALFICGHVMLDGAVELIESLEDVFSQSQTLNP